MKALLIVVALLSSNAIANCKFNFTYEQEFYNGQSYPTKSTVL